MEETPFPRTAGEVLGQLLQAYGGRVGLGRRTRIQVVRRERLLASLEEAGVGLRAQEASVLADGMASGRLALTESDLYLMNDGRASAGVKATCSCQSGSGGCTLTAAGGNSISCSRSEKSRCKRCGFTLGLTIPAQVAQLASQVQPLGAQLVDQLPPGFSAAVGELERLRYPLADRIELQEQLRGRDLAACEALVARVPVPLLSLADALDKLADAATPAAHGLLRLAVGDYPRPLVRGLANALATGAVRADGTSRDLLVRTKAKAPGVTVDVSCDCMGMGGFCRLTLDTSGSHVYCAAAGTCRGACWIVVRIPSELLDGLGTHFALE
jgi:hypothetical protein